MRDMPELMELCSRVERRCDNYRPPDFRMIPTYADIQRRKKVVTAFGTGLGVGIMLASSILILVFP